MGYSAPLPVPLPVPVRWMVIGVAAAASIDRQQQIFVSLPCPYCCERSLPLGQRKATADQGGGLDLALSQ